MSTGRDTVIGFIEVAVDALNDGERKTAVDMAEQAVDSFRLFSREMTPEENKECAFAMRALARMLNEGAVRKELVH